MPPLPFAVHGVTWQWVVHLGLQFLLFFRVGGGEGRGGFAVGEEGWGGGGSGRAEGGGLRFVGCIRVCSADWQ